MSCECGQCRQHFRTLGIAYGVPTESEIQEAYNESVKQWHPDLYENYASLRAEAEERFKQIQVAFRELKEHNAPGYTKPAKASSVQYEPSEPYVSSARYAEPAQPAQPAAAPELSFNGAPGCLTASQFNAEIKGLIAGHLGASETALAIVDLSGSRSRIASYSQFLLVAGRGIMVRNARGIVSLIWYKDMGEIRWVEGQKESKSGSWQKFIGNLSGGAGGCQLHIHRADGALFLSLTDQVDDSVKRALYNFFLGKKAQV
jgi:curved DNA-binding protein CbpA